MAAHMPSCHGDMVGQASFACHGDMICQASQRSIVPYKAQLPSKCASFARLMCSHVRGASQCSIGERPLGPAIFLEKSRRRCISAPTPQNPTRFNMTMSVVDHSLDYHVDYLCSISSFNREHFVKESCKLCKWKMEAIFHEMCRRGTGLRAMQYMLDEG